VKVARPSRGAVKRPDVLVNNAAGYAGLDRRRFDGIDVAGWEHLMAVSLRGAPGARIHRHWPRTPPG
jgi:NAD(P)-dependent dehydrogenase (short-subunit alcohol dehydrogenase family)